MEKWNILKKEILKHKKLSESNDNWLYRYKNIKNNFAKLGYKKLIEISKTDTDSRVVDIATKMANILKNYTIRENFNNVVTDTSKVSIGIEYIIHDDGEAYVDYYKNKKFEEYDFPFEYIFDKNKEIIEWKCIF